MYIADLHIHSKYSRATAADCDAPHLDLWAQLKGIGLVGTGDFTHPAWRSELRERLEPAEDGFYCLRPEFALPREIGGQPLRPRFVVSGEISTIYSKGGKTRKVHHVILLPGLDAAEELSARLEVIGNIRSDGRPILGMDSRDLLKLTMDTCPEAIFIPAHIWTPHFSLFGAFSQFETLEECYGDMSGCICALETGLSSDPEMNRRVSMLDQYTLVSNSDAHSPAKLGREANILDTGMSYGEMKRAIETGEGFAGTIEFYPEEGKYHLDGHRSCGICLEPEETRGLGGRCPVCGRKLTVGVLSRVTELADRQQPVFSGKTFESLMPLPELLANCMGVSPSSKRVQTAYFELLKRYGPELAILRDIAPRELEAGAGRGLAEALRRLRAGEVIRQPGYDGEYGKITVFQPHELEMLEGQTSLFALAGIAPPKVKKAVQPVKPVQEKALPQEEKADFGLNGEQQAAVESQAAITAVIAGPGTGKTFTLVERIAFLVEKQKVSPREITAVTFTHQAAKEMRKRLETRLGAKKAKGITVGTFHAVALSLIEKKSISSRANAKALMEDILQKRQESITASSVLEKISRKKNGLDVPGLHAGIMEEYTDALRQMNVRDLDDVLVEALNTDVSSVSCFRHLLVDEFQDINPLQHQLTEHWMKKSLFVIGDPDQSIYGFRGANDKGFEELRSRHPETCVISLKKNYRSSPAVLEAALSTIRNNPGRERQLEACRGAGIPLRRMQAEDAYSEARWIAREIMAMTGGVDMLSSHEMRTDRLEYRAFSEIAVLCRTHRQLEIIEKCLVQQSIPCSVTGREDFWEDKKVQGMLGFFRWMADPADTASLHTALTNLWNCPASLVQRACYVVRKGTSFDGAQLRQQLEEWEVLRPWLDAAETLQPVFEKEKPRKLFQSLAEMTECSHKPVEKLLRSAVFSSRMRDFLTETLTGEEGDLCRLAGGKISSGAVRLMTLHASKGLEFPVVFLPGINQGDFPLEREGSPADTAEERRLFFVGITRARDELILSSGGQPSSFLNEMPASLSAESIVSRKPQVRTEQLRLF